MGACNSKKEKKKLETKQTTEKMNSYARIQTASPNKFYKVLELLQADKGNGVVNKVKKLDGSRSGQYFARKQIKKATMKQSEKSEFNNQIEIMQNLQHTNIIQLYEIYEDDFNYYLITPLCSGGQFLDKILSWHEKKQEFSEQNAAEYIKQILSAIFYCHQERIMHRDLTLESLLLDGTNEIKINGFGIAKKIEPNEWLTQPVGTPIYMAPEVINKRYNEKCDIWNIGIILYIIFNGKPPFEGSVKEILNSIIEKEIQFKQLYNISQSGINFLSRLLEKDPDKRYSAKEALNDPWILKEAPVTPLNPDIFKRLSEFNQQNKIKHALLMYISTQVLTAEEKKEYIEAFKALDRDNNGTISQEELLQEFKKQNPQLPPEQAEEQVQQIVSKIDANLQNKISINEFITACIENEKSLSEERIRQMFKEFDLDGNGKISRSELETILGGTPGIFSDNNWEEILNECDKNNDGEIDHNEFIALLSHCSKQNKEVQF